MDISVRMIVNGWVLRWGMNEHYFGTIEQVAAFLVENFVGQHK